MDAKTSVLIRNSCRWPLMKGYFTGQEGLRLRGKSRLFDRYFQLVERSLCVICVNAGDEILDRRLFRRCQPARVLQAAVRCGCSSGKTRLCIAGVPLSETILTVGGRLWRWLPRIDDGHSRRLEIGHVARSQRHTMYQCRRRDERVTSTALVRPM